MAFSQFDLDPLLLDAIADKHYKAPTAIQKKAIPAILKQHDLVASAQTGTGKTASFVLPILQQLLASSRLQRFAKRMPVLILSPTRELAIQLADDIQQYAKYIDIRSVALVGGLDYEPQKQQLIDGVDIVVATPGRLLDLAHQRALYMDQVNVLVVDEADRMLDMGFKDELNKIFDYLPLQRQSLLFSATISQSVRALATTITRQPVEILAAQTAPKAQIQQWLIAVDKHNKSALLSHLIKVYEWRQALIFIRTQHGAVKLVSQLEKRGIAAEAIHGGRSQKSRSQVLTSFKSGNIQFLIATGVAARGLNIDNLDRVVNYDMPDDADEYIHRIGRTGRARASGEAVSLVSKDDFKRLCAIERRQNKIIERRVIEQFPVVKDLPASNLNFVIQRKPKSQ